MKYVLWDTRGLGGARSFLQILFRSSPEKELKKFLKERHGRREIDLLVYCVQGSRATMASEKYYTKFCAITRQLAAPVAIMVTRLEREVNMEDWWSRSSSYLKELKMEFDDHVCITTLPGHPRRAESRQKLVDLITRNRRWAAQENGSYFGSPVQKSTAYAPPRRGAIRNHLEAMGRANVDDESLSRCSSNYLASSAPASLTRNSSNQTTNSPAESTLASFIVEPPTPHSATSSAQTPPINTDSLGAGDPPQPSSDEAFSAEDSLYSMLRRRYAVIARLKLLTYGMHEVRTVPILRTLKCTWNLA